MTWTETTVKQVLIQKGQALIWQAIYPEQIEATLNSIAGQSSAFASLLTPSLNLLATYTGFKNAKDYEEAHYPDTFEDRADWYDAVGDKQKQAVEVGRAVLAAGESL